VASTTEVDLKYHIVNIQMKLVINWTMDSLLCVCVRVRVRVCAGCFSTSAAGLQASAVCILK